MTYGSDKILWRGKYGWIQRTALNSWNARNRAAREEYHAHPFERAPDRYEPTIARRYWTKSDITYLRTYYRKGTDVKRMSKHLDRSVSALRRKASELGIYRRR